MSVYTREVVPVDPSQVPSLVRQWNLGMYFRIAIITVLVYDAIITMDRETRYFLQIPRNTVNFVYFVNRYAGIFGSAFSLYLATFNPKLAIVGEVAGWTFNISNWITVILLDYILMIRVLALYSQDRTLSFILKTLLAMEAGFKLGLIIYLTRLDHMIAELARDVTVCGLAAIGPLKWIMVDLVVPLVYGTILMTLAVYKAAEYWRVSAGFKGFTLVEVLLRDQVLYFMLAISCSVFSIMSNKLGFSSDFLADIFGSLGNPAWLSLLGSRMLFNLKEAGERGQNGGTSYSIPSRSVSDIDFNQREIGTEGVGSADNGAAVA